MHTKTGIQTKMIQNIPNGHKMYEMAVNLDQMTIKITYIFYCKTLENLPKSGFFDLKISGNPGQNLPETWKS
jgi:hypothetical protein